MASEGPVILSYYDSLLRKSDVELLDGNYWINDKLIGFWFDYLEYDLYFEFKDKLLFINPEVAHFIKSAATNKSNLDDVKIMLSTMNLNGKELILIPINDCNTEDDFMGGTHWSLLVYYRNKEGFEHYDSHTGSINRIHAENIISILAPILISGHEIDLELDMTEMECTQQTNTYDCGIYLICNAEAICRQYFVNDNRHICDISSLNAANQARRDIKRLIYSLKRINENNKSDKK